MESLQTLNCRQKKKNASIIISPLPDAEIIPGQIRQVFQNLLSNALKFTRKDCSPRIQISGERIAHRNFDAPADADAVSVTMADDI